MHINRNVERKKAIMYKKRLRDAYIKEPTEHEILYHLRNQDIYQYGNQKSKEEIDNEKVLRAKRLRAIYKQAAQTRRTEWEQYERGKLTIKELGILDCECRKHRDHWRNVYTIIVGPRESDGLAHGLLTSVGNNDEGKRGVQWRKATASQMLNRKSITATYLQPIKSKVAYVKYMWKTAMDQMPAKWLQWAETYEELGAKKNMEDSKIAKLYAEFEKKPSKNKWSACLQNAFGLGYPEIKINRSYKNWPRTTNQRLKKLLSKLNAKKAKQMTGKRALKFVKQLLSKLTSKWHGIRLA